MAYFDWFSLRLLFRRASLLIKYGLLGADLPVLVLGDLDLIDLFLGYFNVFNFKVLVLLFLLLSGCWLFDSDFLRAHASDIGVGGNCRLLNNGVPVEQNMLQAVELFAEQLTTALDFGSPLCPFVSDRLVFTGCCWFHVAGFALSGLGEHPVAEQKLQRKT